MILLKTKPNDNKKYVQISGRENNKREIRYVREEYISPHPNLKKYKLMLPKSNGSGKF